MKTGSTMIGLATEIGFMENKTKFRILYLYQHLIKHTDPEHPKSTAELMKMLQE